ncbi:uncharacterized protein V1510DRAFT_290500 [Dipodascopsis tothii]|uniref:uncharacterized protein n=1 Tax=Dipodascopsis tothii TaxID=44089 RepID=UPI0034CFF62D
MAPDAAPGLLLRPDEPARRLVSEPIIGLQRHPRPRRAFSKSAEELRATAKPAANRRESLSRRPSYVAAGVTTGPSEDERFKQRRRIESVMGPPSSSGSSPGGRAVSARKAGKDGYPKISFFHPQTTAIRSRIPTPRGQHSGLEGFSGSIGLATRLSSAAPAAAKADLPAASVLRSNSNVLPAPVPAKGKGTFSGLRGRIRKHYRLASFSEERKRPRERERAERAERAERLERAVVAREPSGGTTICGLAPDSPMSFSSLRMISQQVKVASVDERLLMKPHAGEMVDATFGDLPDQTHTSNMTNMSEEIDEATAVAKINQLAEESERANLTAAMHQGTLWRRLSHKSARPPSSAASRARFPLPSPTMLTMTDNTSEFVTIPLATSTDRDADGNSPASIMSYETFFDNAAKRKAAAKLTAAGAGDPLGAGPRAGLKLNTVFLRASSAMSIRFKKRNPVSGATEYGTPSDLSPHTALVPSELSSPVKSSTTGSTLSKIRSRMQQLYSSSLFRKTAGAGSSVASSPIMTDSPVSAMSILRETAQAQRQLCSPSSSTASAVTAAESAARSPTSGSPLSPLSSAPSLASPASPDSFESKTPSQRAATVLRRRSRGQPPSPLSAASDEKEIDKVKFRSVRKAVPVAMCEKLAPAAEPAKAHVGVYPDDVSPLVLAQYIELSDAGSWAQSVLAAT